MKHPVGAIFVEHSSRNHFTFLRLQRLLLFLEIAALKLDGLHSSVDPTEQEISLQLHVARRCSPAAKVVNSLVIPGARLRLDLDRRHVFGSRRSFV